MSFDYTHIYLTCIYIYISFSGSYVYSQRLNYDKTYSKEMSTFGIFPFISQVSLETYTRTTLACD